LRHLELGLNPASRPPERPGRSGPGQEVGHGIIDQPLIVQGSQERPLDREVELVGVDPFGRAG
jgi:hypothetical protein